MAGENGNSYRNDEQVKDKLIELSNNVQKYSSFIGLQLQSIDSSLLSAFVSLVVTSFLSKQFGLLVYWIPSSFLLMWIVLMFSLISTPFQKPRDQNGKQIITISRKSILSKLFRWKISELNKELTEYNLTFSSLSQRSAFLLLIRFKNSLPLFKTIGVIFFVSLLSLVMLYTDPSILGFQATFPIILPVISCLLFLTLPLLANKAIGILENNLAIIDFNKVRIAGKIFLILYISLFVGSLLVFPILSLIVMKSIYWTHIGIIFPILLVLLLQVITTMTFMNYFSSMSVKKEMTLALLRLSTIQHGIDDALHNQKDNKTVLNNLKENYFKSKPYDITADDTLLINFYGLSPNQEYLSRLNKN